MYILAIDQGTTGSRAVLFDENGDIVKSAYREFRQIYPKPGWVEHDPLEIWESVRATINEVLNSGDYPVCAVGITNQRETTVLWDRKSGKPVYNAIVWQCRRTADICDTLLRPHEDMIREKTGLPVDAYFSGSKLRWLLDNTETADTSNLVFGTVDSWLVWNLTGGKSHLTDYTNASRTMLYNIREKQWDNELLELLAIPEHLLPEVRRSAGEFGVCSAVPGLEDVPILAIAGDQQAALYGQSCFKKGEMKNTYGTGSFVVMNTGDEYITSERGLVSTIAVAGDGSPCYALEGSIFIAGAAVQWLRDEVGIIESASDTESAARAVENNGGVYLVPAFAGLGAPWWDMKARGILTGITRGTNKHHIIRAALESMAYQSWDVFEAMEHDTQTEVEQLMADGGAVVNDFLMQFQADILARPVVRRTVTESTALGAALMAGLQAEIWKTPSELRSVIEIDKIFEPHMNDTTRNKYLDGWRYALKQARLR